MRLSAICKFSIIASFFGLLSEERFHQVMGQQSLWASIYYASNRFLSLYFAFLCLLARSRENLRCILYDEIYLSEGRLPKQLMSIDFVDGEGT